MKPEKDIQYPVLDVIRSRWSGRAFSDRMIEKDSVMQLLEAARWAPSSYNEQPWRFIVTEKGSPAFDTLLSTLMSGNSPWAENASHLLLTLVKKKFDRNDTVNHYAFYDLGQAVAFMNLQAEHLGINMHQMAGFRKDEAASLFEIPEAYAVATVIALGYRGSQEKLPVEWRSKEVAKQQRFELNEIAFFNEHNLK